MVHDFQESFEKPVIDSVNIGSRTKINNDESLGNWYYDRTLTDRCKKGACV